VVVGFSLYARDFAHDANIPEISGQWWWVFPYMPGILLTTPIFQKFLGSGGENFPLYPEHSRNQEKSYRARRHDSFLSSIFYNIGIRLSYAPSYS